MSQFATWGEIEELIEKAGVDDRDIIAEINILGNTHFEIQRDVRDNRLGW